jgi:hypothetical protein
MRIYYLFICLLIYLFICTFEICTLLRNYAARNGNSLTVFRYNLSDPIICPEMSAKNCHYALRNNPEKRRSHLLRGGSLKLRIAWLVCPHNKSEKSRKGEILI